MATVDLFLDGAGHSVDAIQRAAYKFCDQFALEMHSQDGGYQCVLHFKAAETDEATVIDFRTEVLDQVLRERIRRDTEGVRNVILALAFSRAELDDERAP